MAAAAAAAAETAARLKKGSRPPWTGLAAAAWLQLASGNAYSFPLYSAAMKTVLGLSQQQITVLGVANDLGGVVPGLFCNKLPPWALLSLASICSFLGFGFLWLAVSGTVPFPSYYLLWIALCVGTSSGTSMATAVLVTNMRNFPYSRGTVAGILKGYAGISGAVYTAVFSMALNNSAPDLLLFLAVGIPIVAFSTVYFVRPCIPPSRDEPSVDRLRFLFTQITSVTLAVYLLVATLLSGLLSLSLLVGTVLLSVLTIILLSPFLIPLKMTLFPDDPGARRADIETRDALLFTGRPQTEGGSDTDMLLAEGEGAVREKRRRPKRGENFLFREALVKADFWLLWFSYFFGVGSGVTVVNNLAQIASALGLSDTTVLLSVFSFSNFAGRLVSGSVSEHYVRSSALLRTVWMGATQAAMVGAFILYVSAQTATLYPAMALLGFCFGAQISIMVPTASELFGLDNFGVIFNFMGVGNPLGTVVFSAILAGYVYNAEAARQQTQTWLGPSCFRLTFLVLAAVCVVVTGLTTVLTVRIWPVYKVRKSLSRFPFVFFLKEDAVPFCYFCCIII